MADALVSVVLDQLASFISQEIQQEWTLVVGVKQEIENLSITFTTIRAVLNDAEKKQAKEEAVKIWLEKLRDVTYDIDDILDEWSTNILRSQIEGGKKKVCTYLFSTCFCFNRAVFGHKIGHRIKNVRERLDVITSEKDKFNLKSGRTEGVEERRMTSSLIDVSDILGRDHDKDVISSKLLSESSQQEMGLSIISIVGMGGVGKTTLAQLVFNDDKVKSHFEKTMWVCVSDPFDVMLIAKAILEAMGQQVPKVIEWETLHRKLNDSVRGKRFLLMLDDVWNEDPTKWDPLKLSLEGSAQGSKIVVTTRNEKVARIMSATYIHHLNHLSEDDCWSLFSRIAFKEMEAEDRGKLEEIGQKIARKCKGVPLAAKTLGYLMRFKKEKQDWQSILESETWDLSDVAKGILPALLLSYYDFPSQLKRCFTYCSIFPKDYKMEKDMLIKLWMAQGFVTPDGRRELEIIGGEYFDNLVMRSFFQDIEKDEDGKITHCKMHDLVHDLAQFLTKNECFITKINNTELNPNKARHLSLLDKDSVDIDSFPPSVCNAKNLRTLQLFGGLPSVTALSDLFNRLTCLRALDLSYHFTHENLPREIENLIHLRYLDLSSTKLKELPESMSYLYNLQTLKLNECYELCKLPQGMGKLINLRHLEIEGTEALSYLPQGIGGLSSLRTLSKFIVGGVTGGCKIGEIKDLNSLKGSLTINGLERLENVNNAKEAELKNKQHLSSLYLLFDCNDELTNIRNIVERMEGVLEGLQPHPNLERLGIFNYPGSKFPDWMTRASMLSNLHYLELGNCNNCIELTALKKLSSLEVLKLSNMDEVKNIGREFYEIGRGGNNVVFPKLKKLWFEGMNNLEDWELGVEDGIEIMPCLSELRLEGCPKLKALPALGKLASLKKLDIRQMDAIKSMGNELHGVSNGSVSGKALVVFPKLEELCIEDMLNLEEWELPLEDGEIMPRLCRMYLRRCPKLKVLPAVGKLPVLETLEIVGMSSVKRVGPEFCGISDGDELTTKSQGGESAIVIFPKLKELGFFNMLEWEEWEMMRRREDEDEDEDEDVVVSGGTDTIPIIMPCLLELALWDCPKLKLLPYYLPGSPRQLTIYNCPELTWRTPCHCLPPLLEELILISDAGVLSRSLPFLPNLKHLIIHALPHSSFPQGLAQLKALQILGIVDCSSLMSMPEDLKQLTTLQELQVTECPVLKRRCEKEGGEDWSIISHIPNINFERDMYLVKLMRSGSVLDMQDNGRNL